MSEIDPAQNPLGLPTKQVKKWQTNKNTKVSEDWRPRVPMFCPWEDPDTEEKCGNVMRNWDEMFYERWKCCEECFLKYRPDEKKSEV